MSLFVELLKRLPRPISILDVGGLASFWRAVGLIGDDSISILILNVYETDQDSENIRFTLGDGRAMTQFTDAQFDVVFSNSVIEHVGGIEDQRKMAAEMQRVGKRYFLQTPNRYFPIEPHFLFPFFQFLPFSVKVALIRRFNLGWFKRAPDRATAEAYASEIRLMNYRELRSLFPSATIVGERLFGLVKSYIVYEHWPPSPDGK